MAVALLAEGVDRNTNGASPVPLDETSPSSRRAWIEIQLSSDAREGGKVALLAEGVDRNAELPNYGKESVGRPPRGGRG